jgi:hypothetical protein
MTLDDVWTYGRPAYLPLSSGALLAYQPEDGQVRMLAYPHRPGEWQGLPVIRVDVPRHGWQHAPRCSCSRCRPDGADAG